jgi:hypothetical protein
MLKRKNCTSEFRRVRRPVAMKKFRQLDYDSVESCSDSDSDENTLDVLTVEKKVQLLKFMESIE